LKELINKYSSEAILGLILLIGAVLRLHHLGFTSLSNDELSAITRAHFNSFSEMIQHGVMIDFHPAGVEIFMYYWIKLFGDGVFMIRFPFAVAGLLSILALYLVAERWFNRATGLFAAAALSTLQFPLLYSQLARPYAFGMLFILAAAYCWTRILFPRAGEMQSKNEKLITYAGFVVFMSACMHTHYFAFVLAGIIGISGLFFVRRDNLRLYILSGIIILILFLPELPVFSHQMSIGGLSGWLGKPDKNFFRKFINYCFNDSTLVYYLCFGICISCFIYFRRSIEITRFHWLSFLWFLLPFFIGYYYSTLKNPVLQYSILIFGFPFLLIFLFSFIPAGFFQRKWVDASVILFTVICGYNTVKMKQYYWTHHFGVFKEIAEDAIQWSTTYGDDKMSRVISVLDSNYINYYFDNMGHRMKIDLYKADGQNDIARILHLVDTASSTYFLYAWTNIAHPYEVTEIIRNNYPLIIEHDVFFNSEITLFRRDTAAKAQQALSPATDFEDRHWGDEMDVRTDELAHSGKYSEKMDEKREFSISYSRPLADFSSAGNASITAKVWFAGHATDAKLVMSFESGGKSFEWHAADLQAFNLEPGKWQQAIISRPLPKMKSVDDVMKVYVWNPGHAVFYIDDFSVSFGSVTR